MRKIVGYCILKYAFHDLLEHNVNAVIAEGWQPYGPPFVALGAFCQAMVEYADSNGEITETGGSK